MDTTQAAIRTYFAKLGLDAEIADVYLALHSHGPQTISSLARTAKVERTRIYRLIDQLMESNLIELEIRHKRGVIKAAPITNLRILINQREADLKNLHDELGLIEQTLARNSLSNPAMRVQFYNGPEGIRQMLWGELQATGEVTVYDFRPLDSIAGGQFMTGWREEIASRQLQRRIITKTVASPGYSCHIYNDISAYYHWKDGEVFGTEIYNQAMADSQRQFLIALATM